ncbi:hypothetical protein ACWD4N_48570 [Streptomyces sp. NPDC002586]
MPLETDQRLAVFVGDVDDVHRCERLAVRAEQTLARKFLLARDRWRPLR